MNEDQPKKDLLRIVANGPAKIYRAAPGTPLPSRAFLHLSDDQLKAAGWEYVGNAPNEFQHRSQIQPADMMIVDEVEYPESDCTSANSDLIDELEKNWTYSSVDLSTIKVDLGSIKQAFEQFERVLEDYINRVLESFRIWRIDDESFFDRLKSLIEIQLQDSNDPPVDRDPRAKSWESPKFQPKRRR